MPPSLRESAIAIWRAGVDAVDSVRLVANVIARHGDNLTICGHDIDLQRTGRIAVVGAGKAGAGMAAAVEQALGDDLVDDRVTGWVNVPADCVRELRKIRLHAARPAGVNEPCAEGVEGSREILDIVRSLGPDDVCLVLLSGGGSALLPAPVDEVGLADKQAVTRFLMHAGATIQELNCVRKQLSQIKGGRLARASNAGLTIALIISDVIGDPLDVIASGPTVPGANTPQDALNVLEKFSRENFQSLSPGRGTPPGRRPEGRVRGNPALGAQPPLTPDPFSQGEGSSRQDGVPESVWKYLQQRADEDSAVSEFPTTVHNHVIGNNAVALNAAKTEAERLGFTVHSLGSDNAGEARTVGRELADLAVAVRDRNEPLPPPACILSGGEPVVQLVPTNEPRKGGRNQELVLSALQHLWVDGMHRIAILSGGTDGEDGPTDAAGAVADEELLSKAKAAGLEPADYLAINNSYPFFGQTAGLLKTGPTHTNVMDLRVVLVR